MAAVVIKKYGNRRLYDTGDSRYVTLDELATKVRTGLDVRVLDAQTNEDLTQATLTQIVLETGHAAKFLPVQLLLQMIRLSDDSLAEFFSRYVTSALDLYLQAKRGVQTLASYNPLTWMGSPFGQFPQQQQPAGYGYPPPSQSFTPAPPPGPEHEPPDGPGGPPDRNSDVAEMRRELDELKQAIREGLADRGDKPDKSDKSDKKKKKKS